MIRSPFAKSLLGMLAPGGCRGLSILVYHRVLAQPDRLFPDQVDAGRFAAQLDVLAHCFNVLPLGEAVARLRAGTLPPRAASITFDDGYADNHDVALPLLRGRGLHATFFIAVGYLDGGRMWNDTVIEMVRQAAGQVDLAQLGLGIHPARTLEEKRVAVDALLAALKYRPMVERAELTAEIEARAGTLPANLMMSSAQVRALDSAGMDLGAHTVNHPILAGLPDAVARAEIMAGREMLQQLAVSRVRLFAYPNGKPGKDYGPEHVAMVRQLGFDAAVSTAWGRSARADLYQLPRFTPWDRQPLRFALRLAHNLTFPAAIVRDSGLQRPA